MDVTNLTGSLTETNHSKPTTTPDWEIAMSNENGGPTGFGILLGIFYSLLSALAVAAGAFALADGILFGFASLGIAVLAGLYARYLFRGGRFYFFFIVF